MAKATATAGEQAESGIASVDPRAPRFGQSLTTLGLLAGILLDLPILVYAVTAVLVTAAASGWRIDLYGVLWRHVVRSFVGAPDEPEPASPHRFAKLMGATGTTIASALLLAGFPLAGYVVAGLVAAAAGLAAVTGICLGCRMYRQVSFFRRLDVV